MKLFNLAATFFLVFVSFSAHAQVILGIASSVPIVETKNIDSAPGSSQSTYEGYMMVQLRKESSIFVVMGYLVTTSVNPITATSSATLGTNAPYGGFDYLFGNSFYSMGLFWAPYVQGNYSRTNTDEEVWIGNAFYGKLGFHPRLSASVQLDLTVAYFSANYTSKSATTSVSSVDSFSQTLVAPTLGLRYMF